ncbi:reticulon-like protein B21-like protein [Corchorus olitorius]|uniref:Reticulon-like protein B21-like protein n=1 Tax=Corchorus olitorius TaxID=93759 RepID=A0A1R3IZE3_9ROSI|nr:reticulon-like protein B21-like protein [Corchorus olitorius]
MTTEREKEVESVSDSMYNVERRIESALVFGLGAFIIISSSYTQEARTSISGLVHLVAIFLHRSIISRGVVDIDESSCVLGEEVGTWLRSKCTYHNSSYSITCRQSYLIFNVEADLALEFNNDGYTPLLHLATMNGKASDEEHIPKSSLLLGLVIVR